MNPSLRREKGSKKTRTSFLIVCEGEKTEPNYFEGFRKECSSIHIKIKGEGRNTTSLVQSAVDETRDETYDQVWCVFDRDSFSKEQVNAAHELARVNGISVAFSNECFEIWYLLHFHYYNTALPRRDYAALLTTQMNLPYEKNARDVYDRLKPLQPKAISNAEKLLKIYPKYPRQPDGPADCNPCTTVQELVKALNQAIADAKASPNSDLTLSWPSPLSPDQPGP